MAHGYDHDLVDEQADDDGGRAQQDVVDEAHDLRKRTLLAILGQIGSSENAAGGGDEGGADGKDHAAEDGIQQPAAIARRRRHLGEDRQVDGAEAVVEQRPQDGDQPEKAESRRRHGDAKGNGIGDPPAGVNVHHPAYFLTWPWSRMSSSLASASTIKVMTKRMRPRATSEEG